MGLFLKPTLLLAVVVAALSIVGVALANGGPSEGRHFGLVEPINGVHAAASFGYGYEERHFGLVGTIKGAPSAAPNGYIACPNSAKSATFVLTLKRKGGVGPGDVKIKVDCDTRFHIPRDKDVNIGNYHVKFADEDHVAVLAEPPVLMGGVDVYRAVHVNKSGKALGPQSLSAFSHQEGTIEAYDFDGAGSITIKPKKGDAVTFSWGANAVPKIKYKKGAAAPYNGKRAEVSLKRDHATGQLSVKEIQVQRGKSDKTGKPDK